MSAFWSSCLRQLEQELPPQQFNTWIKALRLEEDGEPGPVLRLVAPNRFVLQWVRERYLRRLEEMARQFFAQPVAIAIDLPDPAEAEPADAAAALPQRPVAPAPAQPAAAPAPDSAYEKTRLNPTFTFDTLVTGRANDLFCD
jgi:chromosomal replication initiator protein